MDLTDDRTTVTATVPLEDEQEISLTCEYEYCPGSFSRLWYCNSCRCTYCDECWPNQMLHRSRKKGLDNMPHERVDLKVVPLLERAFNPSPDRKTLEKLHNDNRRTKWFGVVRDVCGRPVFEDYRRYDYLSRESSAISEPHHRQFPQLVSFIGVTNAGKSTLINLLIQLSCRTNSGCKTYNHDSPVVGSVVNEKVPTSGGVHLYRDPDTEGGHNPILFADCEGFEGGEKTPIGSRACRRETSALDSDRKSAASVSSRSIKWASTEESRQREFIVANLYPRLLYTFSDCVVFTLRNPKAFQSAVLTKLIDWGAAAMERSINQPTLPHCIVVLNCSDASLHETEWESLYATKALLSTVSGAINYTEGVPRFRELANHWRKLGRDVCSTEDLIKCYYSSFHVVRMPAGSQYNRVIGQVTRLRQLIGECCEKSFEAKRRTRMQTDAAELGSYLQSSFDHFTTHLDLPFDFMQVSLMHNPIPKDFGDHILQLCLAIQRLHSGAPERTQQVLEHMCSFVASCIMLDCARAKYRKGRLERLSTPYEVFFESAMGKYLTLHTPCEYISPDETRRCATVEAHHHVKGHQDGYGIISSGDFVRPPGSHSVFEWRKLLKDAMSQLQIDLGFFMEQAGSAKTEDQVAWDLHTSRANSFFEASKREMMFLKSHGTCFGCLMQAAQYPLQCGHVLCYNCVRAVGRQEELSLTIDSCPLHRPGFRSGIPTKIKVKAPEESVCVLSLDAGGIRGIVQLETLRAIEQALGDHVPIQRFFDLIVGTGTGGLIAASLAKQGWSVDHSIDIFIAAHDVAYGVDGGSGSLFRDMGKLWVDNRKSRTFNLYKALEKSFGGHAWLFADVDQFHPSTRMAVVSANGMDHQPVLFANYRRPSSKDTAYSFMSSNDPELETQTWQAIGATMADGSTFLPMRLRDQSYVSRRICDVNPVAIAAAEACQIWDGAQSTMLCLSLGTGQNSAWVGRKLLKERLEGAATSHSSNPASMTVVNRLIHRRVRSKDKVLAAEKEWREFRSASAQDQPHAKGHGLIRLNPDLDGDEEPPRENNHAALRPLQASIRAVLQRPHEKEAMHRMGNRLTAASFYLSTNGGSEIRKGARIVHGQIVCRFEEDVEMVKGLGKILRDQCREGFEPYFEVRPVADCTQISARISVTMDRAIRMAEDGIFGRPSVKLYLDTVQEKASSIQLFFAPTCGNLSLGYPLSGLPRVLGRAIPETTLPGSELDMSKERHLEDERRTTDCVSASLRTHPSMRSLRLSSGQHPNGSDHAAFGRGLNDDDSLLRCHKGGMDTAWSDVGSPGRQDICANTWTADVDSLPFKLSARPSAASDSRRWGIQSTLLPPPVRLSDDRSDSIPRRSMTRSEDFDSDDTISVDPEQAFYRQITTSEILPPPYFRRHTGRRL